MNSLFLSQIHAGFASPADDYAEQTLNLHTYLVQKPTATFFVRAQGDSMQGAGIFSGDLLVVDRSLEPQNGSIVLAVLDGEFVLKRFEKHDGTIRLLSEHPAYPPITLNANDGEEMQPTGAEREFMVWGVVTAAIHEFMLNSAMKFRLRT